MHAYSSFIIQNRNGQNKIKPKVICFFFFAWMKFTPSLSESTYSIYLNRILIHKGANNYIEIRFCGTAKPEFSFWFSCALNGFHIMNGCTVVCLWPNNKLNFNRSLHEKKIVVWLFLSRSLSLSMCDRPRVFYCKATCTINSRESNVQPYFKCYRFD